MAINCLGKTKRWAEAVGVFERMSGELGQQPDNMTYGVVINALAMVRRFVCGACLLRSCVTYSPVE